ncbi:hypothetical protein GQ53DRAFT_91263 [Thozetella sp. PMI_491]|nr:hypothetical protein GQ53DRAFT_91263 [Thozetella sp. PMI_491]
MSRNIRLKYARPPAKATKRRGSDTSSSLNLSDEEGYSAVEEISESDEDDEDHVNAVEEEHIISRAVHKRGASPPRPEQDVGEDADEEDDEEEADEEEEEEEDADEGAEESASWEGIVSDLDDDTSDQAFHNYLEQDVAVERHVRFAGVPDSDSDSTTSETSDNEDHEGLFPDIFVEQSSLDPRFRREIEHDDDSSGSGTFWDFHNPHGLTAADSDDDTFLARGAETTSTATPVASQAPTAVSSPTPAEEAQELDGYETDGDTTEEDVPEPPARKKQIRRPPSVEASSDSDTERPVRFRRGKPRTGTFNLDHSDKKPIAVVNPLTRKMMIFTPQKLRRLDLSPESFNMDFFGAGMLQSSPIFSNSGSLMMGALSSSNAMFSSNTFGDFMNTQAIGPEEAFFPFNSDAITGDDADDSDDSVPFMMAPVDEEEGNLKIEDFIVFNQETSDDENDGGAATGLWNDDGNDDLMTTPSRPRTANSSFSAASDLSMEVHPLLNHFDSNSNAVGAFRRNQINQQLIFSERATHESLAFSGPYHYGTLKGIKTNSMNAVSTPITPVRRQKRNSVTAFNNMPNSMNISPSHSVSQKRKASSALDSEHKRHRSISDLDVLQI